MRYLLPEQLRTNLSLGKPAEQWLPPRHHDTYSVLRILSIAKERDATYTTGYTEYFDDRDEDFADVYEFSYVHPDEPSAEHNFNAVDEALHFAIETYGAAEGKFVNSGVVQEEYLDYVRSR